MRTVYKYPFFGSPGNTVYIALPEGAEIVRFALQDRTPTMWAIVDSDKPFVQRLFSVIGTGWAIPDGGRYLGTVEDQGLVWHGFEVTKLPEHK